MNQKAKFQVCKYEKGLFAFPTSANCELLNSETTDATTVLQTLPNCSQIELRMCGNYCLVPGCLRAVLGFLKKICIFCILIYLVQTFQKKKRKQNQKPFIGNIFSSPSDLNTAGFTKPLSFFLLRKSTEVPINAAPYLTQPLWLSL